MTSAALRRQGGGDAIHDPTDAFGNCSRQAACRSRPCPAREGRDQVRMADTPLAVARRTIESDEFAAVLVARQNHVVKF
jgi:hypothetical protein